MYQFTVISVCPESGQIMSDHVLAESSGQSFLVAAKLRGDQSNIEFVASLRSFLEEGDEIEFPGDGVVSGETILEQEDVFA